MNVRHFIQKSLTILLAATSLSACQMMTEDLSDCPTGLYVNFVYDYNIQRADMFKDHVGDITLYVYDETDRLVAQRTVNGAALSRYGFNIHFTEQELAPGHRYRLQALALQKDWTAALRTPGAKYRHTAMPKGNSRQQLNVSLDRATRAAADYHEVPATAPLDTLWHTLTTLQAAAAEQPARTSYRLKADGTVQDNGVDSFLLEEGAPTYATVSLIRDTFQGNGVVADENTAHYDLMFNRLMYNANTDANAVLCIRRKDTGNNVAVINLPYILAEGRTAYELNAYSPQEYLDREYDYRLEFFLRGDRWQYVSVCIDVLSWAKRIQYVEF